MDPSPPSPPNFNHIGAFWWPPLLPAYLALCHTLGVPSVGLPWAVALWTSLSAPLMFSLLRLKTSDWVAFWGALLTAFWPNFLLRAFQMSECFSLPLVLLFLRAWLAGNSGVKTGLLAGACTLARFPNALLAVLFIPSLLSKKSRAGAAVSLAVMALTLAPWILRNKLLLNRATLSVNGPYLLYATNHPLIWDRPPGLTAFGSEGRGTFLSFPFVFTPACFPDKEELLGPGADPKSPTDVLQLLAVRPVIELTDLFERKFRDSILSRPWDALGEIPWKLRRLLHWHTQSIPGEPSWFFVAGWLLQACGLSCLFLHRRHDWVGRLGLFILTQLALAALFYGNDRFRTGLDLSLIILVCVGFGRQRDDTCPKIGA